MKWDKEVMAGFRIRCGRSEGGDKDIVIFVVQQYWLTFNYASEGLKKDKWVVPIAVHQDVRALQYATNGLKGRDR